MTESRQWMLIASLRLKCSAGKNGIRVTFPREGDQGSNKVPADIGFLHQGVSAQSLCTRLRQALVGTIVEVYTFDTRTLQIPVNDVVHPSNIKAVSMVYAHFKDIGQGKAAAQVYGGVPTF
ncbi:hypothetical protein BC830DRAFT_732871 [Chytriomyces sp. MP71]|nr:hypothetical protein BC830DRAFT_732871 [Chytriomyces sp. MP71]